MPFTKEEFENRLETAAEFAKENDVEPTAYKLSSSDEKFNYWTLEGGYVIQIGAENNIVGVGKDGDVLASQFEGDRDEMGEIITTLIHKNPEWLWKYFEEKKNTSRFEGVF